MYPLRTAAAALLFAASTAQAAIVSTGSLADPEDLVAADLTSATITVADDGAVTFVVGLGPSTDFANARVGINIDIDQNTATGFPGITNGNADSDLIGLEYLLQLNAFNFQGNAGLLHFNGVGFDDGGTFALTYDAIARTITGSLNLSDLGGDDGLFNFKLTAQQQLAEFSSTPIQDFMSDLGQPVGTVAAVPEPTTWALVAVGAIGLLGFSRRSRPARCA